MEYIDQQCKVKPRYWYHSNNATLFYRMELIEASIVKAVDTPCDIYETDVDVTI